jgi:hypothetical protein
MGFRLKVRESTIRRSRSPLSELATCHLVASSAIESIIRLDSPSAREPGEFCNILLMSRNFFKAPHGCHYCLPARRQKLF